MHFQTKVSIFVKWHVQPQPSPLLPIFSNTKQGFFYNEVLLKNILSLTLTVGCKNKKQPSSPIELDLEAGNLVLFCKWLNFETLIKCGLYKGLFMCINITKWTLLLSILYIFQFHNDKTKQQTIVLFTGNSPCYGWIFKNQKKL